MYRTFQKNPVIPAQAGIQATPAHRGNYKLSCYRLLDSGLRRNDGHWGAF